MSLVKKVDRIADEIKTLNKKELIELVERLNQKGIDIKIRWLEEEKPGYEDWDKDEKDYYDFVNESLKEVWDNDKDNSYNNL